ncbi:MAG: glycosyltransferase family 1 protein [Sphingobacteriales bacterium]|nr:MAG: glycosyltransferase family 1 protein [Sphingobacteriales bacterium]
MKRILFDNQIFRKQPYGGISKYFTELLTGLKAHHVYKVLPKKFYSANVNLVTNNLTKLNRLRNAKFLPGRKSIERVIVKQEELVTLDILQSGKFDVFHPTYFNPYFLDNLPAKKPLVVTVHDMIHENYYSDHYEYLLDETYWKRRIIPRANHIIAVSEYTKQQVLKYFPDFDAAKISVVYHGINPYPANGDVHTGLPEKYILFVGVRKHYKNFIWLARALAPYLLQHNITLLCAGATPIDLYENEILQSLKLDKHVKQLPLHNNENIGDLYSKALCFVFPSAEEGFGIPILEAFVSNCPVVLANSSCFPEIAGDAALYFDLTNKEEIVKQIDKIINEPGVKDDLVAKGQERAKLFTWEDTVAKHVEIYNSLLS